MSIYTGKVLVPKYPESICRRGTGPDRETGCEGQRPPSGCL